MKMSSGQMGRRLLGLTVAGMTLAAGGAAFGDQPRPWEITLQEAATPVMENIISFHNLLLVIITIITLFVLALLVVVVMKFNAKANPVPSGFGGAAAAVGNDAAASRLSRDGKHHQLP